MVKILILLFAAAINASEFYVTSSATSGDGSINNPWSLRTALSHPPAVKPGDTIWLRGGIYKGRFVSTLTGTTTAPIVVKAYPGEWVTVDGYSPTTVVSPVLATATSILVEDASNLALGDSTRIGNEGIYIKAKNGGMLSVIRGWGGTIARDYPAGTPVTSKEAIFQLKGSNTVYAGIEVMSSDPVRISTIAGSSPPQISRGTGVYVIGQGITIDNFVVHDAADGIALPESSAGATVQNTICYYNGWQGPDRGHGHGLYIQNRIGIKTIRDVISFNNFATGMKAFGQNGYAVGVDFDGVISFNNGSVRQSGMGRETNLYVGTDGPPADLISIRNTSLYHPNGGENMHLGYIASNKGFTLRDTYIAGGSIQVDVTKWETALVTGNTFVTPALGIWSSQTNISVKTISSTIPFSAVWDSNSYFDAAPPFSNGRRYTFLYTGCKNSLGGSIVSFSEWQRCTGYDTNSTYTIGLPTTSHAIVRQTSDPSRVYVSVYNWGGNSSLPVDLTGVLCPGERYQILDSQNIYGPVVVSGIFDGSPVALPLDLTAISTPVGNVPTAPKNTAPAFAAFVILKKPAQPYRMLPWQ